MKTGPSESVAISMAFLSFGENLIIFEGDKGFLFFLFFIGMMFCILCDGMFSMVYDWSKPSTPIKNVDVEFPG